MFFRTFRAHLVSSEYNHHVYTKALTLSYSFHELVDEASLVGIAAILPELRLLIQETWQPTEICQTHELSCNVIHVRTSVIVYKYRPVNQWMIIKMGYNV
jgi:hypothetical protein